MEDDDDIYRQRCEMYAQANILLHMFSMWKDGVRVCHTIYSMGYLVSFLDRESVIKFSFELNVIKQTKADDPDTQLAKGRPMLLLL